jgi:hypothetical protein
MGNGRWHLCYGEGYGQELNLKTATFKGSYVVLIKLIALMKIYITTGGVIGSEEWPLLGCYAMFLL